MRAGLLAVMLGCGPAAADVDTPAALDIPPAPVADVLLELAAETGISIVFLRSAAFDAPSPGVRGTLSALRALPLVIGRACLRGVQITPTLLAVREGCAGPGQVTQSQPVRRASPSGPGYLPPGVEEIIVREPYVTGSRIRLPDAETLANADIMDSSDIALSGNQDIGALLRALPAVAGNATSTLVTNGGDGTANITLRGLPASNTLVLLNGRRTNPDPWGGRSVDLNSIPLGLVDRIEVLKEGASALYGSDAIAGVVNIVTDRQLSGLEFAGYYGRAGRDDLGTVNTNVSYGGDVADLHFTLGASYYDQDPVFSRSRGLSASSDDRLRGGSDKRSSATTPARITLNGAAIILADPALDGSDPSHFRPATQNDLFEYRQFTTAIVPSERYSVFADLRHPAAFGEVHAELLFTDTRARNTLAPTPLFTAFEMLDLTVAADAAFNPFDVPVHDVRRRFTELGVRHMTHESQTKRAVFGWDGFSGPVHWDTSYGYHRTNGSERRDGLLWATRVAQALGPAADCSAPCVPLDLFGPEGSIGVDALDFLSVATTRHGQSELHQFGVNADFPIARLPAGTVEVASGLEFRRESLTVRPDELITTANTIGGTSDSRFAGSRQLWEAYAEAWIPLVSDMPGAHRLETHLAVRRSQYSDFGGATNPRVSVHYHPVPSVLLRASATRGFRAPTLRQLHAQESQTFEFLNDPCALAANVGVLPGCTLQSDPTLVQFMTIRSGDRTLDPERARTYTAGVVLRPKELPGFWASVDVFRITSKDVVDANAQILIDQAARSMRYTEQVQRDASGNIQRVFAPFQNIGRRSVSGIDVEVHSEFAVGAASSLQLALKASHIASFDEAFEPGGPTIDYAGTFRDEASAGSGALPDWKVNLSAVWANQLWNVGYHIRYVSSLNEIVPIVEQRRTIDAWHVDRVQASYLGPYSMWTKVTLGIDNIWDAEPPFAAAAFNDSYDSRTYDITGRYAYLHLQKSL